MILNLARNDRVRIRSKRYPDWTFGLVVAVRKPSELPDLPGLTEQFVAIVRQYSIDLAIKRVALIEMNQTYIFSAVEIGGQWFDLGQNELTIEVL